MGVFEKLPYLNYHDINLDWLVRQTKKNASDNTYLMKIFKWFEDHGLVGVVTEVTENPDDTVKIDYVTLPDGTPDDFTVYDKTGADNAISGAQSAAEGYADTAIANAFKSLGDLPTETDLQNTDLLLINRSGVAEAIAGDVVAKQSDMTTAQGNITNLQGRMTTAEGNITSLQTNKQNICMYSLAGGSSYTFKFPGNYRYLITFGLISGAEVALIMNCRSGVIYQTNVFGTNQLTFTADSSFEFSTTLPASSALTVIGYVEIS